MHDDELTTLRQQVVELRAAVDQLEGKLAQQPAADDVRDVADPVDRRAALGALGKLAVGALAGGAAAVAVTGGEAAAASGIFDSFNTVPAVTATNTAPGSGVAVRAVTSGSFGAAVVAVGNGILSTGLLASATSYCVHAFGSEPQSVGVLTSGQRADLQFSNGAAPELRTKTNGHNVGEVVFQTSPATLWVCVGQGLAGQVGTWKRVAYVEDLPAAPAAGPTLLPLPKRVYDSRPGEPPDTQPKSALGNGQVRTINCTLNGSGVPGTAKGLIVNVTALWLSPAGFLSVTPGGAGFTGTSNVNSLGVGSFNTSNVTVAAGAGATIDLFIGGGGTANVIVDVVGFYA